MSEEISKSDNALELTLQTAKVITQVDKLSEQAISARYAQAKAAAEQLPEGPEREAAKNKTWEEFARANQQAHERRMRAMRELLGKPEQES